MRESDYQSMMYPFVEPDTSRDEEIVNLYSEGMTLRDLCHKFKINLRQVYVITHKDHNIYKYNTEEREIKNIPTYSNEQIQKTISLSEIGYTHKQIGKIVNLSNNQVQRILKNNKMRPITLQDKCSSNIQDEIEDIKKANKHIAARIKKLELSLVSCNLNNLLTSNEAQKYLGIGRTALDTLTSKGSIKATLVGVHRYYEQDELNRFKQQYIN